jgi:chromosomal replication initiation ATPase DnaA
MINPMLFPAMTKSQQLRFMLSQPESVVTPDMIIEKVCFHLNVSREDITGLTRLRPIANARQQAMYLINLHCKITLKRIGALLLRW